MATNVYNPHVEGQQNSACRLKLIKGANMIQVGWRVDPTLYCNNATRFFIHFQDGENACFNLLCPAFVLVNPGVAIDGAFDIVSQRGGKVYEIGLSINWDQNEGNWWLFYTETNTPICFWPREVFDDFDYFATSVEWGGVKMIMNRKIIIQQLLLLLFLCLSYDGVRGTKLSDKQEDLELERQLKRLNKPAIKTITTEYGDIYDCVDFYKQPAFDHPLLKNHNYHPQMKPSSYVKESDSTTSTSNELPRIRLPEGGCPVGTVPIRRTTKEDLIRHKLLPPPEDIMVDNPLIHREISIDSKKRRYKPLQGYKLAIIHTEDNPSNKFGGGAMTTSIYNPHVKVDPTLYGDNATRLYIHFQDGKNACFNLLCPAFVLVNREIVVDGALYPVSQRGGKLFETKLSINWDLNKGNCWFDQNVNLICQNPSNQSVNLIFQLISLSLLCTDSPKDLPFLSSTRQFIDYVDSSNLVALILLVLWFVDDLVVPSVLESAKRKKATRARFALAHALLK
ncbi:uncharacterized protein LOC142182615 [Nicotiana tabacum]|uniref:Uncharacterized protein LOC142182615 n=1 Tax=Nicotiana tabacum TaxID=4097 RepID=A0AC58UTU3_TOBAC